MINSAVLVELCLKSFVIGTISKCLYNLFLTVERTHRISLAGFSDLQCVVYITFLKQILRITVLYLPIDTEDFQIFATLKCNAFTCTPIM